MTTTDEVIGKVLESSPNCIVIEIKDYSLFEKNKSFLQIGKILKISEGNNDFVLCSIQNIKSIEELNIKFIITAQPLGIISNGKFERGFLSLPVPTEPVYIANGEILKLLYQSNKDYSLPFGKLVHNKDVILNINGNNFFSKHIAIVGSTGSGKSCTVAKIIQDIVGIEDNKNLHKATQKNSHIIIFDIHSEYQTAFDIGKAENFTLNVLDINQLKLPYWLMNSEELESLFIESNEQNSHNQVSQFKKAVIMNKKQHNPDMEITYDSPVFFDISEISNFINNKNNEVISKLASENKPKLANGNLIHTENEYFKEKYEFVQNSTAAATKATNGAFNGEFNRFISRLETKLSDERLHFLINPKNTENEIFKTADFSSILQQFLGYINKSNITIIDLSGVPFEVLSITVSLISRLVFDFAFHYSKLRYSKSKDNQNDVPFMIVCEEAHNYVPRNDSADYRASRKSIERIAKEGRKYGLSLMVVSQRPSEVSETIFAQCNNFISLRLTNINDQNYIKSLLPENTNAIAEILPSLADGECLIVGDATLIPSIVKLDMPAPQPNSRSVKFHDEWRESWKKITFDDVIKNWKKKD